MSEPNTNPIPLLIRARELIAAGWGKGTYYDPDTGCYCALGAVRQAAHEIAEPDEKFLMRRRATHALARQIDPKIPDQAAHGTVIDWNDDPRRTQPEVVDLFDRTIAAGGGES